MNIDEINIQIATIQKAIASNPTSDVVEYTIGNKTVKKDREALYKELSFWREEAQRLLKPKRTILTRF